MPRNLPFPTPTAFSSDPLRPLRPLSVHSRPLLPAHADTPSRFSRPLKTETPPDPLDRTAQILQPRTARLVIPLSTPVAAAHSPPLPAAEAEVLAAPVVPAARSERVDTTAVVP